MESSTLCSDINVIVSEYCINTIGRGDAVAKMSQSLSPPEKRTLTALDRLLRRAAVRASIDAAIGPLERRLLVDTGAQMAWETVSLSLFYLGLPDTIRHSSS